MSEPKPMDPKRLDDLRTLLELPSDEIAANIGSLTEGDPFVLVDELLAAHDYHVKRAEEWERKAVKVGAEALAEVTRLKAENARLRARVRIEAEDIRRAGVTRAKCEAYVLARLGEPLVDVFPDDPRTWPTAIDGVIICIAEDPDDLAERWRILDEMAAMEVPGG